MYGRWFIVTFAGVGLLLLAMTLAVTPWAPLYALGVAAVIGMVLLVFAALRRAEDQPALKTHRGDPERYAAPVSGEGGSGQGGSSGDDESPEAAPAPESAGIWGERRR